MKGTQEQHMMKHAIVSRNQEKPRREANRGRTQLYVALARVENLQLFVAAVCIHTYS